MELGADKEGFLETRNSLYDGGHVSTTTTSKNIFLEKGSLGMV